MKGTQLDPDAAISLRQAIAMATPKAIELWLDVVDDPAERAYQLLRLSSTDRHRLGEVLDTQIGPKLLGAVDVHLAARVIKAQAIPRGAELLGALDAQLAVRILRRFHHDLRDALLSAMPIERAIALRSMLLWPIGSVAAHMSTEPLTLGPTTTAEQAVEQIRDRISNLRDDADAGSCVYVTGPEQQLLGVLTEDQAVGIREVETTEDAEKQGGSTPLEVPYLRASPWRLWRKRIIWLLVLFVAEAYTGTVLRAFEDEMEAVVALAFFIPLLIGTGGNTGTQITTTLVRAMGTGQVRFRDLPAVVTKELSTGTLIALAMAPPR